MAVKRNIFRRLFGGFIILSLALSAAVFISLFFSLRSSFIALIGTEHQNFAEALAVNLAEPLLRGDTASLRTQAERQSQRASWWRITIVDKDGKVLVDTDSNPETMESHFTRPEFLAALRGESIYEVRYSQTLGEDFLYSAAPIYAGGNIIGAVRISVSLRKLTFWFFYSVRTAVIFTLIFFLLFIALALYSVRRLVVSLGDLEQAALRVADDDLTARVYLAENDEFRPLADNFNLMASRLASSLAQIRRQKAELETILASIAHGLMVIDNQGQIKLGNKSLQEIAGTEELENKFYWQIFREEELGNLLRKTEETGANNYGEFVHDGRYYMVNAAQLPDRQGLVVLMRDITAIRELERIKRDFVTNASHELRTPLTAIKGFAEMLEENADSEKKHYVDVIKNNTERLISIVQDIMTLSELEARGALEKENINLKNLLADLQSIFAQKIAQKNLTLEIIEESPVEIYGDVFKLQQVFINLIDNAVKYTEKGGVIVRIAKTETQAIVSVEDTGSGISAEDLPRIFERFYMADKSRSRKLGGTGLGLSIVKHIVLLHGGEIRAESSPAGSKFIVVLPI